MDLVLNPTFRRFWRLTRSSALAFALGSAVANAGVQEGAADEHAVKAAVLCHLPKFVEWPARENEPKSAPLVVGVVEPSPFGVALDRLITSCAGSDRRMVVRRIRTEADIIGVHVLYIGKDARDAVAIREQAGLGVLTVGDSEDFLASGGIVRLVVVNGKIRFEINAEAATRASLKLSSQLLKMARTAPQNEGSGS